MYKLVPNKKGAINFEHDYMFKDFNSFYQIANVITVPLVGKYSIGVTTDDVQAIKEFIAIESKYSALWVSIYVAENIIDNMTAYDVNLSVAERVKPFDVFKQLVHKRELLFEKKLMLTAYMSIEHTDEAMGQFVEELYQKFGSHNLITERMLSEIVILNKVVYPRTVLIEYLMLDRWREYKLRKCLDTVGNDVALGACIKNIKNLFNEKVSYYKTGKANNLVKVLSARRINLMYRVLVSERCGMTDLSILLKLYERGLSCYDFMEEEYD